MTDKYADPQRVFAGPIVAVSVDVLDGGKDIEPVLLVLGKPVEFQASSVDAVFSLFGYHGLVWWKVQIISSTSEF